MESPLRFAMRCCCFAETSDFTLDGRTFARFLAAGASALRSHRREIDASNVFPVADGDTGTNMYVTLRAASVAATALHTPNLHAAALAAARASLLNARGNSGTILAALLDGFSHGVRGLAHASAPEVATAMHAAAAAARAALVEPVEGTMLSVATAIAEAASGAANRGEGATPFLATIARAANEAVDRTPQQLDVLARAGVVDAGAAGLAHVVGAEPRELAAATNVETAAPMPRHTLCIQFVIAHSENDTAALRRALESIGNSIVVVGSPPLVKVHMHAEDAQAVRNLASPYGALTAFTAEDMQRQHTAVATASRKRRPSGLRSVAIVTDSTSDIGPERANALGITVVPLSVVWGNRSYRDHLDISRAGFYERMARETLLPTTSQPPPSAFEEAFRAVIARGDDVLCITISSRLSGTINAANAAKGRFPTAHIEIVDSRSVSGGLGMLVERAVERARIGTPLEHIVAALERERSSLRLYACLRDLSHAVRTGRITKAQGALGTLLRVTPIFTLTDDGGVEVVARVRTFERATERMLSMTFANAPHPERSRYRVIHANAPETAARVVERLLAKCNGCRPMQLDVEETGPVVAVHGGPGAVGIFSIETSNED